MKIPFARTLRAPINRVLQFAATQCCLRKIRRLTVSRSLPLEERIVLLGEWLDRLHSRQAFNGTVLLAELGRIFFEQHYGIADADGRIPLSGHSSFSLASVSKQFTGMGIMLLAQQGRLKLDATLAQHIPELARYRDVTITQMLQHTSGLPDHMWLAEKYWDPDVVLTTQGMIALFLQHRPPPHFAPGERFEYSNTGYVLLGEIISRTSGTPYADFMANEIFKPLHMADSAAFNLASKECTLRSRTFGLRKRFGCFGKRVNNDLNYLDGVFGDGSIYASAEDLVRWDAALRDGTLIACEAYEQAYVSGKLNDGRAISYGFGWEIKAANVVEHRGAWEGFTSYLRRDLKKHTLVVVLSNLGPWACVDVVGAELVNFVESL